MDAPGTVTRRSHNVIGHQWTRGLGNGVRICVLFGLMATGLNKHKHYYYYYYYYNFVDQCMHLTAKVKLRLK